MCENWGMARMRLPKLRRGKERPLRGARLIVGLGNPDSEHRGNRHNAGLRAAEAARRLLGLPQPSRERLFRLAQGETRQGPVAVALPRTYMNESGRAVQALLALYGAEPADLILIVDELDLPPGRIRVRGEGGHAGQNGMRNIQSLIGELGFPRVRIGVGRPIVGGSPSHAPDDVANHLLSDPLPEERQMLRDAEQRAAEAVVSILKDGIETTMNRFNG